MSNLSKSPFLILLALGICFHFSFIPNSRDFVESIPLSFTANQFTMSDSDNPIITESLVATPINICQLSPELCTVDNLSPSYTEPVATDAAPVVVEYTEPKVEKTLNKVADILSMISRLIISITGAIYGTRVALRKLP